MSRDDVLSVYQSDRASLSEEPGRRANDPLTAVACIDWLGAGLRALTGLALPSPFRSDGGGVLRP